MIPNISYWDAVQTIKYQLIVLVLMGLVMAVVVPFAVPVSSSTVEYMGVDSATVSLICKDSKLEYMNVDAHLVLNVLRDTQRDYEFWGGTPIRTEKVCVLITPKSLE